MYFNYLTYNMGYIPKCSDLPCGEMVATSMAAAGQVPSGYSTTIAAGGCEKSIQTTNLVAGSSTSLLGNIFFERFKPSGATLAVNINNPSDSTDAVVELLDPTGGLIQRITICPAGMESVTLITGTSSLVPLPAFRINVIVGSVYVTGVGKTYSLMKLHVT